MGALVGARAGEVLRVEDEGDQPAGASRVVLVGGEPWLMVGLGDTEQVNNEFVTSDTKLRMGDVVTLGREVFVIEARGDIASVSAPSLHLTRADDRPGGPWPYWNEPVRLGASSECELQLVDDGVEDQHALIFTRFGRVLLEDQTASGQGVVINRRAMPWAVLKPGTSFRLGQDGPTLKVAAGQANLRPRQKAARAMKPSRHNRTVLDVLASDDTLLKRVFVFTRREVRFGAELADAEGKLINELALWARGDEAPGPSPKQGELALTRDGVEVHRSMDGATPMTYDGEPLELGDRRDLKRQFLLEVGGIHLEGQVYRSPSDVEPPSGPPQLGLKGGHPFECVVLERVGTPHVYVFLVRMLRVGSEASAPLRLPELDAGHLRLLFSAGKFQVVAPKAEVIAEPAEGEAVTLEPGVSQTLSTDTTLHAGDVRLRFRVVADDDFA